MDKLVVRNLVVPSFIIYCDVPERVNPEENLGTGQGVSVLELVEGMGKATGKPVPYEFAPRRPGDVATVYADASLASDLLGWKANLGVDEMCADTWRWQSTNPYGYQQVEELQEQTN